MAANVGVLALQGDFQEHRAILAGLGADSVEVRLPEQLDPIAALIIPGGESTTIARLLHRWGFLSTIRRKAVEGMAIWGTCAGAILLAERATDLDCEGLRLMDISSRRNAFGRQVDSFQADLRISVLGPKPFPGVFIRAPVIADVGPKAAALATLPDGTVVAARQGNLLVTSFHPELTSDARFHQYFLEIATSQASLMPAENAAAGS